MKNFFRAALIIAVVLALALTIVACDKKADTTTAKADTTTNKPVVTTTAKVADGTTAPVDNGTTAAPATTATPTTAAPITEVPYDMEVPCARIEGSDEKIYAIWNCEYFIVTDEGYVTVDDGCNASIATLVYEDGTPVKWTKGTIEFLIQVTDPETYTSKTGTPGANDSGMIFGIADVPQDELRDYFWESQRPYLFAGCSDAMGLLFASCGRVRPAGTAGWHTIGPWPLIPDFAHGQELRIKIEYDGEGTLYLYANDMDNPLTTYVFSENPESEAVSDPFVNGSGIGIRAEIPSLTFKEIVITMAE